MRSLTPHFTGSPEGRATDSSCRSSPETLSRAACLGDQNAFCLWAKLDASAAFRPASSCSGGSRQASLQNAKRRRWGSQPQSHSGDFMNKNGRRACLAFQRLYADGPGGDGASRGSCPRQLPACVQQEEHTPGSKERRCTCSLPGTVVQLRFPPGLVHAQAPSPPPQPLTRPRTVSRPQNTPPLITLLAAVACLDSNCWGWWVGH